MNLVEQPYEQPLAQPFAQDEGLLAQAFASDQPVEKIAIHKFGGSSLASATAISRVTEIIESHCQANDIVVVSAMGKTTDKLFALVEQHWQAQQNNDVTYQADCQALHGYQAAIIAELLSPERAAPLLAQLDEDIHYINTLLSRNLAWEPLNHHEVIAFGEVWSSRLVAAALEQRGIPALRVDARSIIHTADPQQNLTAGSDSLIHWRKSQQTFNLWRGQHPHCVAVVTGYIATDHRGHTVTLGRNGSDFSATILAKLASAKIVCLWTDVNGVYSADPNLFEHTHVIPVLGLNEANALASLGSSVFHQKTLNPLIDANIPIRIRHSQTADLSKKLNTGTLILSQVVKSQGAKTLALKQSVALVHVRWHNQLLATELTDQLLQLLSQRQVAVFCYQGIHGQAQDVYKGIGQPVDQQFVQFCVAQKDVALIAELTRQVEASARFLSRDNLAIISLVGSELLHHADHLAQFFALLSQSNSANSAAEQAIVGYHYDNNGAISAIVDVNDPVALSGQIHQQIFVAPRLVAQSQPSSPFAFDQPLVSTTLHSRQAQAGQSVIQPEAISLVIIGLGQIGQQLVRVLSQRLARINVQGKTPLKLIAVANSRHCLVNRNGFDLTKSEQGHEIIDGLRHSELAVTELTAQLAKVKGPIAIIDVTASAAVAQSYKQFFAKGYHVISASKLGLTLPEVEYQQLIQLAADNHCRWYSNVSCGAGLPIQQSLRDLHQSGDQISAVSGLFSGSLSWILNQYDGKKSFSQVVSRAKALGYTEPDPRDDLSGQDIQRKLLIIARSLGLSLALEDIELTPLIPAPFLDLSPQQFADSAAELDLCMQQKFQHAHEQGLRLCYSAELSFITVDDQLQLQNASVGLSFREANDPLVNVSPADNIVVIQSQWYRDNPLIIRGPGAGVNVTAAGIMADIIKLTH